MINYQAIYLELFPALSSTMMVEGILSLQATQQLQMQAAIRNEPSTMEIAARNISAGHRFSITLTETLVAHHVDLETANLMGIGQCIIFGSDYAFVGMLISALSGEVEYDAGRAKEIFDAHATPDVKKIANGEATLIDTVIWLFTMGSYNARFIAQNVAIDVALQSGVSDEDLTKLSSLFQGR